MKEELLIFDGSRELYNMTVTIGSIKFNPWNYNTTIVTMKRVQLCKFND